MNNIKDKTEWLYGERESMGGEGEVYLFIFPLIVAKVNILITECPLDLELKGFEGNSVKLV